MNKKLKLTSFKDVLLLNTLFSDVVASNKATYYFSWFNVSIK